VDPQEIFGLPSNEEIVRHFDAYLASEKKCDPVNNGRRVIISGFGLWSKASINYSGFVVDNLASSEFWPEEGASLIPVSASYKFKQGVLGNSEGVRIVNRSFRLHNGQQISACLIISDVRWNFAGAVIANEMTRFQPDAVIMTGVSSGAYLESGSLNVMELAPGHNSDGTPDLDDIPINRWILRSPKTPPMLPMTWDNQKLSRLISPLLKKIGLSLTAPKSARSSNDYICNNTSYLALAAARNLPLHLAGDEVVIRPQVYSNPQVGFFHFPNAASADVRILQTYAEVVLTLAEGMLK
jgi:hypothetical protein